MAGRPLRPATRQRLGRPLPHQQADRTRPHPMPQKAFPTLACAHVEHPALPPVSRSYSGAWGRSVTHYSPVRHSHPGSKLPGIPFDLHVLSTPPAFILSQNRTLHKKPFHGDIQSDDSQKEKRRTILVRPRTVTQKTPTPIKPPRVPHGRASDWQSRTTSHTHTDATHGK